MRTDAAWLLLAMLLPAAAPAHHSLPALYDMRRTVQLTGTLRRVDWLNPHVRVEVEVEATGRGAFERRWNLELGSPKYLADRGWGRDVWRVGATLTAVVYPARDGSRVGFVRDFGVSARDGRIHPVNAATSERGLR